LGNWSEGDALHHINTFYVLFKDWYHQKNYTAVLLTREGYHNKQVEFGLYLNNGGDSRESLLNGNSMAYKWVAKYHVLTVGKDIAGTPRSLPTTRRLFTDLWKIHQDDHCKGSNTFSFSALIALGF